MSERKNTMFNPAMEAMSRDERTALQSKRLRETVRREYDNVPVYRARMDEIGVKPEDIRGIEDLKHLPFTEKTDLRDYFPYGLFASPLQDIVRIQGSSGTTGKPIVAGYTANDVEVWTEMMARTLSAAGAGKDDIVQVAYGYGLFTGGLGAHQGAGKIGATVIPMSSGNTHRQLLMLRELGTTILCCTPSYALYLGESLREAGVDPKDIKLRAGCFGAEPWTEAMRKRIEELLGIDALDVYGLTEICGPGVAFECMEKHGMHINEDHVIAEILDPVTHEPLPCGQSGELVFTTITKEGMPMLRYRTHDICVLDDTPCACGRTLVRMGRITGRTDDMLVIRGVNVFPSQIESVLVGVQGVAPHYMLVVDRVHSTDTLEVQVEMTDQMFSDTVSHIEQLKQLIRDRIKQVVGITASIKLVAPRSIPRSEGKAKRVIDNRKL
ncbi:MAG TPA: phenylacetate--CoA ligase [Candidatus Pullichristensenella excrementigallinarum]|uniref:Phenylacetate-coenzyme A ligase n=1 Tax=Candidatus Pullichristensenella excrementigallinarum TaxID=2840907 RepID=A0A9D1ICP3_9FIRM|nr:phenylacetate--CoA ligase [Candidatus Pullichristensenella excrementigallinarum]